MATIRRKLVRRLVREAIRERERQGEPQVKMHDPRFRIEGSSTTPIYHLGNVDVVLKKELGQSNRQATRERVRKLARVSLKPSTIHDAGYGVFLREAVAAGQLLLMYWGRKLSIQEAARLRQQVTLSIACSYMKSYLSAPILNHSVI
jgi:hypothetical protein